MNSTEWSFHESNKLSGNAIDTSHQYGGINHNQENKKALAIVQSGQELKSQNSQLGPIPDSGVTSDHMSTGYGNAIPSLFYAQPGVHSVWSPKPVYRKESSPSPFPASNSLQSNPESHYSKHHHCSDDATCTSPDQTVCEKTNLDPARQDSPAADQSTSNTLCHENAIHNSNNISACKYTDRSDGNATSAVVVESNPESLGDSNHHNYDGFRGTETRHPSQREAALTKFRMKRKDRERPVLREKGTATSAALASKICYHRFNLSKK